MNRRDFMKNTSLAALATAGAAALPKLLTTTPVEAAALAPSQAIVDINTVHAKHIHAQFTGTLTQQHYVDLSHAIYNLAYLWAGWGLDPKFKNAGVWNRVNENMLNATHTKPVAVAARVNQFGAVTTPAAISAYINWSMSPAVATRGGIDARTVVVNNIRQNGMYPYIIKAAQHAQQCALQMAPRIPKYAPPYTKPQPVVVRKAEPMPPTDPSGPTACQWNSFDSIFAGAAFLTLSVMTGGLADLGIAAIITSEALLTFANLGGFAAGVWGIGSALVCPI